MRYIPLAITVIVIIVAVIFFRKWQFEDIVDFTPENLFLSALVIIAMFAVKSLSVVIPLTIMFVASGVIFSLPGAIIVCLVGVAVCFSIPYAVGRISGSELVDMLAGKNPLVKKVVDMGVSNDLFAAYVTRAVVFVPGDVVSILLGAMKLRYVPYVIGSLLGVLPELVFQIAIGHYIGMGVSSEMIAALVILIVLSFAVSFVINKLVKRKIK